MRKRWNKGILWKTGLIPLQQTTRPSPPPVFNSSSSSIFFAYYGFFFFCSALLVLLFFHCVHFSLFHCIFWLALLSIYCILLISALFSSVLTENGSLLVSIGILNYVFFVYWLFQQPWYNRQGDGSTWKNKLKIQVQNNIFSYDPSFLRKSKLKISLIYIRNLTNYRLDTNKQSTRSYSAC